MYSLLCWALLRCFLSRIYISLSFHLTTSWVCMYRVCSCLCICVCLCVLHNFLLFFSCSMLPPPPRLPALRACMYYVRLFLCVFMCFFSFSSSWVLHTDRTMLQINAIMATTNYPPPGLHQFELHQSSAWLQHWLQHNYNTIVQWH